MLIRRDNILDLSQKAEKQQTQGHGERGGEGEMYGKSNMETYIGKIDSQWEFAIWLRKLKPI